MPYITYIKKITGFMKNSIEITDNAQNHIANNLKKDKAKFFRITVSGGGCAGFQYKFEFENIKKNDDLIIKMPKINVLIDSISINFLKGSKIDYVNELIGSSFKITNPKATSSCGCGTSFSI